MARPVGWCGFLHAPLPLPPRTGKRASLPCSILYRPGEVLFCCPRARAQFTLRGARQVGRRTSVALRGTFLQRQIGPQMQRRFEPSSRLAEPRIGAGGGTVLAIPPPAVRPVGGAEFEGQAARARVAAFRGRYDSRSDRARSAVEASFEDLPRVPPDGSDAPSGLRALGQLRPFVRRAPR
jgi:hypothetical protein